MDAAYAAAAVEDVMATEQVSGASIGDKTGGHHPREDASGCKHGQPRPSVAACGQLPCCGSPRSLH
jgi:hypothetical protein